MKLNELVDTLSNELVGVEVNGRFGTGKILSVAPSHSNFGCGFMAEIQYPSEVKKLLLNVALKSGAISLPENNQKALQFCTDHYTAIVAAEQEAERQRRAAEQLKREQEEAERKYKEKVAATIEKATKAVHTSVDTTDEELLWLKDNGNAIKAAMPDFLEKWFVGLFGDVKRRVVDQSKKGPSGWVSQWGFSLSMKVKNPETAPFSLRQYINDKGQINNTTYLARLVLDHDFTIA